jgi:hypothetical protein
MLHAKRARGGKAAAQMLRVLGPGLLFWREVPNGRVNPRP